MLKIFNTITKKKEYFYTIKKKQVNIYVCGITAYDLCHIGHGRTFLIFDMVIRYLKYLGYKIYYIRNITDIEDKIINKAYINNINMHTLTQKVIKNMQIDFNKLNMVLPNFEPKATQHINEIIKIIKLLIKKKNAYICKNGDVLFSIKSYLDYGKLSQQNINFLKINLNTKNLLSKKNKIDFVLWKKTSLNQYNWNSPWGLGRPGWHIECSAMCHKYMGKNFDIHGGGTDLIFPHHENEIAQSICAFGGNFANFWMHTGMIFIKNEKMSKSLNNFLTLRDLFNKYNPEVIRYFIFSSHYRSIINYNKKNLYKAYLALKYFYETIIDINTLYKPKYNKKIINKFKCAMNDDFNTPKVYAILFNIARKINSLKNKNEKEYQNLSYLLIKLGNIIGILKQNPKAFLNNKKFNNYINKKNIKKLIKERNIARKHKNWKKSDEIRDKLKEMNISTQDNINFTKYKKINSN